MNAQRLFLLACVAAGSWLATDAAGAASSNTIVRFQLGHGTTRVGDIDVELFDHDKPITVSNFLYYVESGAFDRSILHRCVPRFIVQGGLYAVDNPYPSTPFQAMTRIPEGPPIINESTNGLTIHNTFGTLAMALSPTNSGGITLPLLDSATASWYFNTADNSDLLDPEFTVFGRVTAGASLLKFFNTLSEGSGIINMLSLDYLFSNCDLLTIDGDPDNRLDSLPVSYRFFDCPVYSTLFNVHIFVLNRRDVAPPKIIITSPAANESVVNDPAIISGTVADNVGVEQVRVYLGGGTPMFADLNTANLSWSVTLTNIPMGTNMLFVEATDTSGNRSSIARKFFRSVLAPIGLDIIGTSCADRIVVTNLSPQVVTFCGGAILGATNGQLLEIGRSYTLTARPAPGNLFDGWGKGGVFVSSLPAYSFVMESNLTLVVMFQTNLFPYVKGTYTGLFCGTNQVEEWNSGFLTLTVTERGNYSARIWIDGKSHPLTGTFNAVIGNSFNYLVRPPFGFSNDLFIHLDLDLSGGSDRLSGSISHHHVYSVTVTNASGGGTNIVTTFHTNQWGAELRAHRPTFTSTNPAPQAGRYTLLVPADPSSTGPIGDGYGTVTISTRGSLSFSGSLPDGTKVTQKVPISKDGDWPIYLNLYKGKGTFLSRVVFDTNATTTDLSGLMNWFKRTQVAKYYGAGFTNESMIAGSRFVAPTGTNRLLGPTTAVVGFTNGNLTADFANDVTLDAAGKVTNLDLNKLSLSLSKSGGLMSGSATPPPAGSKAVPFKGAVLQKQNRGAGYFLGTNSSGRVSLDGP